MVISCVKLMKNPNLCRVKFASKNFEKDNLIFQKPKKKKKPQEQKISTGRKICGYVAGSFVGTTVSNLSKPVSASCMNKLKEIGKALTDSEYGAVKNATSKLLKVTGLDKKGVSILSATAENSDAISKVLQKEFSGNIVTKLMPERIKKFLSAILTNTFTCAQNAAYTFKSKKLILPEGKKLSLAAFHEVGHAMNANLSTVGKLLQKIRPLSILAIPISIIALLKSPKKDGEKPQGIVDKTTTFVKNNAGKLTFLSFLPMLIEEGMASLKGNSLARKLLSPELASKVAKTNKIAYLTYLGTAIAAGLGVYIGTKIRDKICEQKTEKV